MAMDLFLSPLGIAINLLSRVALSHCFFLMRSATKPPLAARKPPSNARAARCRFPTARAIEVAGKGLRRVGHLVFGRVPVRVVRHREARFPGSSEPLTVTPYQHLPPRTRNCYLELARIGGMGLKMESGHGMLDHPGSPLSFPTKERTRARTPTLPHRAHLRAIPSLAARKGGGPSAGMPPPPHPRSGGLREASAGPRLRLRLPQDRRRRVLCNHAARAA